MISSPINTLGRFSARPGTDKLTNPLTSGIIWKMKVLTNGMGAGIQFWHPSCRTFRDHAWTHKFEIASRFDRRYIRDLVLLTPKEHLEELCVCVGS